MMGFDENIQSQPFRERIKVDQLLPFNRRNDQEYGISPVSACFVELDLIDHELFVQGRHGHRLFDLAEVVEASLEKILVCQDGQRRGAMSVIALGNLDVVKPIGEFGAQEAEAR